MGWNSTLNRRTPLKQGSRLRPFGRLRQRRRAKGEVYGSYHVFVAKLPCVAGRVPRLPTMRCGWNTTGHHLKSIGAGGTDYGNEVALCFKHHDHLHVLGRATFERLYDVDLAAEAARVRQLWEGR
jgi:hypothetical protein